MANRYFRKTNTRNRIILDNEHYINWEPIPGDEGVRKLDPEVEVEARIISVLESHAERRIGGVSEVTAEEYKDLKKNHSAKGWGSQVVIDHTTLQKQVMFPKRPFGMSAEKPVAEQLNAGRSQSEPKPSKASKKPKVSAPPKAPEPPAPEAPEDF